MSFNRPEPSKALRDAVDIEVDVLYDEGYGNADIYWHEYDQAVIVADRVLVEVYPDPDEESGFVMDRHPITRG